VKRNIRFSGLIILLMFLFGCTLHAMRCREIELIHTLEAKKKILKEIEDTEADLKKRIDAWDQKLNSKISLLKRGSNINADEEEKIGSLKNDLGALKRKKSSLDIAVAEYKNEILNVDENNIENVNLGLIEEKEKKIKQLKDQIDESLQILSNSGL
jgi:hypothetical protein